MNIDLQSLLAPISATQRCGEDLTFSNAFHEIKKAQTHDDPLLDQGDWVLTPKQADWSFVAQRSVELLSQHSKDIRLMSWLIEAWSHLFGFEGMAHGLNISQQLLAEYWHDLHPQIEEDDLDQRLGLLQGMLNQLPNLIKQVPLNPQYPNATLLDYENLLHQQHQRRKHGDEHDIADLTIVIEQAEQRIVQLALTQRQQQYQHFLTILAQWQRLKQVLAQWMQQDAPRFAQIDAMLEQIDRHLKKLYQVERWPSVAAPNTLDPDTAMQQRLMAAFNQREPSALTTDSVPSFAQHPDSRPATDTDSPTHANLNANSAQATAATTGAVSDRFATQPISAHATDRSSASASQRLQTLAQTTLHSTADGVQPLERTAYPGIHSREQALDVLQQIAEYFKHNEPQSPVSYVLQKAIHWSQLPLHEWLAQVIKQDQSLAEVREILGVARDSNETHS